MSDSNKDWLERHHKKVIAGIIILMCSMIIFAIVMASKERHIRDEKREVCERLYDECEKYGCLAEIARTYNAERNLLLKQQNCLLERGETWSQN